MIRHHAIPAALFISAVGMMAVAQTTRHQPALPLSAPWGTYDTRESAIDAARDVMRAGRCARLEPVNARTTELQPC